MTSSIEIGSLIERSLREIVERQRQRRIGAQRRPFVAGEAPIGRQRGFADRRPDLVHAVRSCASWSTRLRRAQLPRGGLFLMARLARAAPAVRP